MLFQGRDILVSVIIASLNRKRFIQRAIDSALNQSYKNIEIVVVDGGSTDGTVELLEAYGDKVRWLSEKDEGESDANNKGTALCKGEIVNFLPSDDMLVKDAVETAVRTFENSDEKTAIVNGDGFNIDEQDHVISFRKSVDLSVPTLLNHDIGRIIQPSTFMKKKAVIEVGGWDKKIIYASDLDLWIRILKKYSSVYVQKPMSLHREHSESTTIKSYGPALIDSLKVRLKNGGSLLCPATFKTIRAYIKYLLKAIKGFEKKVG